MNKYIGTALTILLALLAFAVTFGAIKTTVEKNEERVEKAEEEIIDIKMIDMRQTVILEKLEARF